MFLEYKNRKAVAGKLFRGLYKIYSQTQLVWVRSFVLGKLRGCSATPILTLIGQIWQELAIKAIT